MNKVWSGILCGFVWASITLSLSFSFLSMYMLSWTTLKESIPINPSLLNQIFWLIIFFMSSAAIAHHVANDIHKHLEEGDY